MHLLQTIFLGIIQGATEFIPISSSGHLVLIREFLGWQDSGIALDIMLHLATLLAILFYFRKKIGKIIKGLGRREPASWRLAGGIILATLPAVLAGYFGADLVEKYFRSAGAVGLLMICAGIVFILIEKRQAKQQAVKSQEVLTWADYLWIGIAQAAAILPGVSRSGATIAAGMGRKMARKKAADFSFLLAIPAIFGAGFYDLLKHRQDLEIISASFLLGFIASFVVGYLSIRFLIRYLKTRGLNIFAYYLWILGSIAIIFSLWQ
ncbi:undecaprenyl-diphosphatase UppP [bacterium (Candidatus Torokbacteria) CG09_land_8_20_14_0_10_42_11]|nr:MAG: undecaprenyl-diphosphatase UppP [bacterium (Candidatus Torokbacteria) CG09_land_8_20_14_0_10_42_11]